MLSHFKIHYIFFTQHRKIKFFKFSKGWISKNNVKPISFKEKKPLYSKIDNVKLKKIIKLYNVKLWNEVINSRDGVELPDSLGYLFIGTCKPSKTVNTNYALSKQYGKVLQNKNWETDGNIGIVIGLEFKIER